jgi:hypothetical protein
MTSILILNGILMFAVIGAVVGHLAWAIMADHRRVQVAEIRHQRRQRRPAYRGVRRRVELSRELG